MKHELDYENINLGSKDVIVYETGNRIYRIFSSKYSEDKVRANIDELMKSDIKGIKMPKALDIFTLENRMVAVEEEKIDGTTLLEEMIKQPDNIYVSLEYLVDAQLNTNKIKLHNPENTMERIYNAINTFEEIDVGRKERMLEFIKNNDEEKFFCHMNLNLSNVILENQNADIYVLNWALSGVCDPYADAAHTYLYMSCISTEYAEQYLRLYCKKSGRDKRKIHDWLPVAAALQLTEGTKSQIQRSILYTWTEVI